MEDDPSSELLNVKETARRLGVHENTVRNWVRQGLLVDARLPGSRFHRFRAEDVERLRLQRGAAAPTLQGERRVPNAELVGASQLDQWPETRARDAQSTFPELIRRLLAETPGTTIIDLRAGDGVATHGLDGVVESDGSSAYLPAGRVIFELGVGKDLRAKATDDYTKRLDECLSDCVFVFATPRRWSAAARWAEERRSEGHFRDVRVFDADLLEGWLEEAPSAHHWLSEHLGLRPRSAISLDTWWHRFSTSTEPILPLSLFAAGRSSQLAVLRGHLAKDPQVTSIECEWSSDGLAFVQAAVAQEPTGAPSPLVISEEAVWSRVVERHGRAILIPQFDNADVDSAINAGHHVIAVLDSSHTSRRAVDLTLPRLDRTQASEAFRQIDIDWSKADNYAVEARRSLPALVRRLSRNPQVRRPRWTEQPQATPLAALMLCVAWTDSPEDQELLCELTQMRAGELEVLLEWASATPDPLFRNVGNHSRLSSPEEAFLVLSDLLTPSVIRRWADLAHQVLLEPDPYRGMDDRERLAAQMQGTRRRYSATLRRGVAHGLAMVGAMGGEQSGGRRGITSSHADQIVRGLFAGIRPDDTANPWVELADVLPHLAEASPESFLTALEDDLERDEPAVQGMFVGDRGGLSLGPSSPHPSLLWAVETVCWSPDHLIRGARVLAQLGRFELPENSGNKPLNSLSSLLCGWVRHTSADVRLRLDAVDAVYAISSEVGWQLLLDLMPTNRGVAFPPSRPDYRLWMPATESVPMSEWAMFVNSLVDRMISWSTTSPSLLPDVLGCLSPLSPNDRDRLVTHLEASSRMLADDDRLSLFEALEAMVAKHERFATSHWALPEEVRARLAVLVKELEPQDDVRRLARLYDWHPDLPGVDQRDFESYRIKLEEQRRLSIDAVMSMPDPIRRLEELARRIKVPRFLGWLLAERPELGIDNALDWLRSGDAQLQDTAIAWLNRLFWDDPALISAVLTRADLTSDDRLLILRSVPANGRSWAALDGVPEEQARYWEMVNLEVVEPDDVAQAIEKLLGRGRAWTAIAVAAFGLQDLPGQDGTVAPGITPTVVVQILRTAITADPGENGIAQGTSYYIGQLLDYLERSGASKLELAQLEFAYYRILEHTREPKALSQALATDPSLFVDFVRRVYRGKNERPTSKRTPDDMATQAMWVLHGWHGFPGQAEDGSIDADIMRAWVSAARLELAELDRADIGDEVIGQSFAYSPAGDDGIWPARPVRELVETIGSRELEHGFVIGRLNSRGVHSRGVYEGGDQERALATRYREWSRAVQPDSQRTARILRLIAESYERDALREDREAQIDQDRD